MTMVEMIQPGWSVVDSNGEEVGTVVRLDENGIHVRKPGILGGELVVPKSACAYAEEGRVELSATRKDLESRH